MLSSLSKKRKLSESDDTVHPSNDVDKAYDIVLKGNLRYEPKK